MIDPGQMRTRLVYEELVAAGVDAHGRPVQVWTPRFELWALVQPVAGREAYYAAQTNASRTHVVTCRYRPGFGQAGRLRFKNRSRVMQIESIVDVDEANDQMTIGGIEQVGA